MKRNDIKKILVIGSGPIIIGQAAEFDYAGSQACLALREEGYQVVLINSNPATIMTDTAIADKVYIEPITLDSVSQIIYKERPDAILPTLGGQTGLNMAVELSKSKILEKLDIELLGTTLQSIEQAEDRELFKALMQELKQPIPESEIIHTEAEAFSFIEKIGYPVIIRPAFTLGGTGGGICHDEEELIEIVNNGLSLSPVHQVLIEKSIAGYKEIEFEVMRDHADNAMIVCGMENFDPVGIHTGDSIVFAPIQTLTDDDYQMLRDASLRIIRALKIEGGCNVQLALDPNSSNYYVIEVNPRVSRSSALASKATAYPIAKIAAKIAIGINLDELINPVTGTTYSQFEPALDYVVSKIPRWPFDKFDTASRVLGTQMKATGEVMAIGRTLEESLLKAVRSLELGVNHFELKEEVEEFELIQKISKSDDMRIFYLVEAIRKGYSIEELAKITKIDVFFLDKLLHIVELEEELKTTQDLKALLPTVKEYGFCDAKIGQLVGKTVDEIRTLRKEIHLLPTYKMLDTCAGEFISHTKYFYSSYDLENESFKGDRKSVIVLGSGPIRIGQGVEFDYSAVHAIQTVQELGYEAIIINSNPETVSTDFSISDKLYFEPLTLEDVLNVIDIEKPIGVIAQFGGQTGINLVKPLVEHGVTILGTSAEDIDTAEDRNSFEKLLKDLKINQPKGKTVRSLDQAIEVATEIGYPVLVRPSYVLGGRAMEIIYNTDTLKTYIVNALKTSEHPVLIDKYLQGKECEVDAISDGTDVLIPGIMEHIEKAGIHSGDSMAVYPPFSLSAAIKDKIVSYTTRISQALKVKGIVNIQFVIYEDEVYIIEVNPRGSRTVPFLSKVTQLPMAKIATRAILGESLKEQGVPVGLYKESVLVHVKAPVFSFTKLNNMKVQLSPEMKSTGEVMGSDTTLSKAIYKAFRASGVNIPLDNGKVFMEFNDVDTKKAAEETKRFTDLGYTVLMRKNAFTALQDYNLPIQLIDDVHDVKDIAIIVCVDIIQKIADSLKICQFALTHSIPLFTSFDTTGAVLDVLEWKTIGVSSIQDALFTAKRG